MVDEPFQAQQVIQNGISPSLLLAADLNNDGFIDIASADTETNGLSILPGLGSVFGSAQIFVGGRGPRGIVAGNFNGDNLLDLITADIGSGLAANISVFLFQP